MSHKAECAKTKDSTKPCDCGEEKPTTRKCWGCDETIGISEKACPKCKLDIEMADEEDSVVERAWARIKKKRDALKGGKKEDDPPKPPTPPTKRAHPFKALAALTGRK